MQPLSDTLVVDFTRYLPGAYASRELARLGARVVRVEPPGGDPMRSTATAWDTALRSGTESVVCELPNDAAFARALSARADVVLEGFRPGVAERLGIGPGDVPETVVYCSITGFGDDARHRLRAGHDVNYLGWAGVLEDTVPELPPIQVADLAAGALGAVTQVLAGLLERARTGRGPRIVVSMTHRSHDLVAHRLGGEPVPRLLTGAPRVLPHLCHGRRPPPHRRRARAEVLPPAVRARRPPRACRSPVRERSGSPRERAG